MKDSKKKILVNFIAGLIMVATVVVINWEREFSWVHKLCDGCFVAGVLLAGMGGLRFARNKGTFDVMSYSVSSVLHTTFSFLRPQNQLGDREESFLDWRDRKQAARKPAGDLLIPGGVFLAVAVVLLIVYVLTEG